MKLHSIARFLTVLIGAASLVLLAGCDGTLFGGDADQVETGTIGLSLTDAPLDDENVTGVYITITGIQYGSEDEGWQTMEGFDPGETNGLFNLLSLTGGESLPIGNLELPAGDYSQIRFLLDAPVQGQGTPETPGAYLEYADGTTEPLFVPSGSQSGFKATSPELFTVPANGTIRLTADFDARKSVVVAGQSGMIILKPTIRLIVDGEAGEIAGALTGMDASKRYTVLAYENDGYVSTEADDPEVGESRFPTAVTSFVVEDGENADGTGDYTLAYLAAGTYDLYVAEYTDTDADEVFDTVVVVGPDEVAGFADVVVEAGVETPVADVSVATE